MSEVDSNNVPSGGHETVVFQSPYKDLADQIYRERVIRARQTPVSEKILAGPRLFESACKITLAGIRNQFPGQTEERYLQILRERLALRRRRQRHEHERPLV